METLGIGRNSLPAASLLSGEEISGVRPSTTGPDALNRPSFSASHYTKSN